MVAGSPRRVVIVGASLAGLRTAEALRSTGCEDAILLVGDERHQPYDRPPLSKQLLSGARTVEDITLRPRVAIDDLGIELRLGQRATALEDRRVQLNDREWVPFSDLVIATGVSARRMPDQPNTERVHLLRTLDDSIRLREDLRHANSLLVLGGGFIGAEVAAVARAAGLDVTMLERLPEPFARALGPAVAARCADMHRQQGVRVVTHARVTGFHSSGRSVVARLDDGRTFEADCALVGVGTTPNTAWLRGAGLDTPNGIPCDDLGRVDALRNVYAVGDVAAWRSRIYGGRHRVEHWTNAAEQAHAVARAVLGQPVSRQSHEVPYFWSDQYGTKLQLVGRPDLADRVEVADLAVMPGRVVGTYFRGTRLVAAVTFGAPAVLARYRPLVATMADEKATRVVTSELVAGPVCRRTGVDGRLDA